MVQVGISKKENEIMGQKKFSSQIISKDYAGLYPLIRFVIKCLSISSRKELKRITLSVSINLIAVLINVAAVAVLYRALKVYFENDTTFEWLAWLFEFNAATRLFFLLTPAFVLMLISSVILRLGRVHISRFVLDLKDTVSEHFTQKIDFDPYYDVNTIEPILNGLFGAVRALFLNLFAIIQAALCFFLLLWLDFPSSLFLLLFFALFTVLLLLHHERKITTNIKEASTDVVEAVEDEFLGLTSKSFERLEKMRFFGRNMNSALLVLFVVFAIASQREYTETLYDFMLMFFLIRYIGQVLVPLSVLSAAVYPFRKNAYCYVNIMNMQKLLENRVCQNSVVALMITRDAANRELLTQDKGRQLLKKKIGVSEVFVGTARFTDEWIMSDRQLQSYLQEKTVIKNKNGDVHARILFSI